MRVLKALKRLGMTGLFCGVLLLGIVIGAATTYMLVGDRVVKDELYTSEVFHLMEVAGWMRSQGYDEEASGLIESRILDRLSMLKRPLLGDYGDSIAVEDLRPKRLKAFQAAKEYFDRFGWDPAHKEYVSTRGIKEYIDRIPWSRQRQELNAWNAKYKGPIPAQAPELASVNWLTDERSLADLKGKVVLLDFWGMRCGPCIESFPKLQKLHQQYRDKGLQVIAVHSQRDQHGNVAAFIESKNYTFDVCLASKPLYKEYRIGGLPAYYLIDKQGRLVWGPGHEMPSAEQIKVLLAEDPAAGGPQQSGTP